MYSYVNLKNSTLNVLKQHNKLPSDIKWVGCTSFKISIEEFWKLADKEYDAGYGCPEVAIDLIVVGDNWWLERHEYDGSEWWEYKELPQEPEKILSVPTLFPEKDINGYYTLGDFNER